MLFIAVTPVIVARGLIREIREERTVTIRTMFGVLCIYLLIGVFFAFVYAVIDAETATRVLPRRGPREHVGLPLLQLHDAHHDRATATS